MKRIILLAVAAVLLSSCGGAGMSAPPVSIPAPVTGRIVVSSPEDGSISIVGEAGAVEAGEVVMAENTTLITSFDKIYFRFLDYIVASAYAEAEDSLPAFCNDNQTEGRACVIADGDGSFTMFVAGEEGDEIEIVTIDEDGNDKSERIRKEVPVGVASFALPIVDVSRFIPGESQAFVLMRGGKSVTTDGVSIANNKLVLMSESTRKQYPLADIGTDGAVKVVSGSEYVVVGDNTSTGSSLYYAMIVGESGDISNVLQEEGKFSKIELTNNTSNLYEISDMLMHNDNYVFSTNDTIGPSVVVTDLTLSNSQDGPSASFLISTDDNLNHCSSHAIDRGAYQFPLFGGLETEHIFMVLSRFSAGACDGSVERKTFITVYRWIDVLAWFIEVKEQDPGEWNPENTNFPNNPENGAPFIMAQIEIANDPGEVLPIDMVFIPGDGSIPGTADDLGGVLITDSNNDVLHFYPILQEQISNTSPTRYDFDDNYFAIEDDLIRNPLQVTWINSSSDSNRYAMVTLNNGDEEKLDTVIGIDISDIFSDYVNGVYSLTSLFPVGLDPYSILVDPNSETVFVGNYKSRNITSFTVDELVLGE